MRQCRYKIARPTSWGEEKGCIGKKMEEFVGIDGYAGLVVGSIVAQVLT